MSEGTNYYQQALPNTLVAAAHELKTPLAIISQLAASMSELTPAQQVVALERIQLSADRGLRLVAGLTTVYKLDQTPQLSLELEPVNARQVCEEAIHEITPFAKQYSQELQLVAGRPQLVVGNRDLLHCMCFNLLDNAVRHSITSGVVRVDLGGREHRARIRVSDNGPGVSSADVRQLKRTIGTRPQPVRSHSETSGLGLYIVGRLASAMGGRLSMGRARQGATFFIDLHKSTQLSLL